MDEAPPDGAARSPAPGARRPVPAGALVVVALFLFAALFLWALFALTDGKRRAPPPETRDPRRAARTEPK